MAASNHADLRATYEEFLRTEVSCNCIPGHGSKFDEMNICALRRYQKFLICNTFWITFYSGMGTVIKLQRNWTVFLVIKQLLEIINYPNKSRIIIQQLHVLA